MVIFGRDNMQDIKKMKRELSAVHKPLKERKEKNAWLKGIICRRAVSHYTLREGLVGKTVLYFLFNKVVFKRNLKIKEACG